MKDESADAADRQCGQHFLGAASAKVHGRMNPGKGSATGQPRVSHIYLWQKPKGSAIVDILTLELRTKSHLDKNGIKRRSAVS